MTGGSQVGMVRTALNPNAGKRAAAAAVAQLSIPPR